MKCICNGPMEGSVSAQIFAVKPEEWAKPPQLPGTYDVQGLMNDFEKSAYTVFDQFQQMIAAKQARAEDGETTQAAAKALRYEIRELQEKASAAKMMMAFSIRDRLKLWGKTFALSHDHKVVTLKEGCCLDFMGSGSLGDVLESIVKVVKAAAEEEKKGAEKAEEKP